MSSFDYSQDILDPIVNTPVPFSSWHHSFWHHLAILRIECNLAEFHSLNGPPNCTAKFRRNLCSRDTMLERVRGLIVRYAEFDKPIWALNRRTWLNVKLDRDNILQLKSTPEKIKRVNVKKQAQTLTLLCRLYVLIYNNSFQTKRDLFYRDAAIYRKYYDLCEIVEDLCLQLEVARYNLHIKPYCKGTVYGNLKLIFEDDEELSCLSYPSGVIIPSNLQEIERVRSDAKFILVIEKDASFQYCIETRIIEKMPLILITGKGFPDASTREMLRILVDKLGIPALGLCDGDPYGIEIICIYRFGSMCMAHNAQNMVVPELRWIGMHPSDVKNWNIPEHCLLPLNKCDKRRLELLQERPYLINHDKYRRELDILASIGVKAGIQALFEIDQSFLAQQYLPQKIKNGNWI